MSSGIWVRSAPRIKQIQSYNPLKLLSVLCTCARFSYQIFVVSGGARQIRNRTRADKNTPLPTLLCARQTNWPFTLTSSMTLVPICFIIIMYSTSKSLTFIVIANSVSVSATVSLEPSISVQTVIWQTRSNCLRTRREIIATRERNLVTSSHH